MSLDEELLRSAREAASRWSGVLGEAELAKADYHRAVRRLYLAGGSMREIADALDVSHQRVHQMIEEAGGTAGWKPRQKAGADLACSFCGAAKTEVARLVAGPGVFICDGCVALSGQVIQEARSLTAGESHLDPVPVTSTLTCSFCSAAAAERIVAGPGVRICDQCVQFCAEVMAALPD
ncbi:MAG TPA: ClpX C4-type zinc finger protein [Actinokineospora sp.]|nr:ClpX C4-type zinc finger protein [Actinokineospora sp.]